MLSFKIYSEFTESNCAPVVETIDLLPHRPPNLLCSNPSGSGMADKLHKAICSMSLDDDDPITLLDEPRYCVFDANANSILGRLLNPDAQNMARMIEFMPRAWRLYNRVQGIALSRDRFQFIFDRKEDLLTVLKERPLTYNHWTMLVERWVADPPRDFLTSFEVWIRIRNIPLNHFTTDTMYLCAKKIGRVVKVAYDPKVSHTTYYIRAKIVMTVDSQAFEAKKT
ncbi:uncharacterized protein LOC108831685 [Raphanus sativus]|uniref:Uncharacterized protein LOC108831685 n=1 Tax=Raphanus sativus TaxID=3726 RepID=A0A6J0LL25_RAPSA|nr:uncharacterized protein LOC108831685 [Raphanus sativus]